MTTPTLPARIRSSVDALQFFGHLTLVDNTSFHPDDSFVNQDGDVAYVKPDGTPAYTIAEAVQRDHLMQQAFRVTQEEGFDIYQLGLWGSGQDLEGAPDWVLETVLPWGYTIPRGRRKQDWTPKRPRP